MVEIKADLARRTGRGVNNIVAGIGLWIVFGILGILLPDSPKKALIYLFGAGLLFPLGLLVGSLMKLDIFAKGNPLSHLPGYLGGLQILFIPLMVGAYFASPNMVPWYLGVLVGAHFLPFGWLYDSKAYTIGAVMISLLSGLVGWLFADAAFVVAPFVVASCLVLLAVGLAYENKMPQKQLLAH